MIVPLRVKGDSPKEKRRVDRLRTAAKREIMARYRSGELGDIEVQYLLFELDLRDA